MLGIVLVWFSAIMFVHLGLGDEICKVIRINLFLFRCVKCLSFWTVLGYSFLIVELPIEGSVALAFLLGYAALWIELLLDKLADWYDEIYKSMVAKEKKNE